MGDPRIAAAGRFAIPTANEPNTFLLECFIVDQTPTARQQNIFIEFFCGAPKHGLR
jgi:hypothetical protein